MTAYNEFMHASKRKIPVQQYREDAERFLREAIEQGTDLDLVADERVVLHLRAEDVKTQDFATRPAVLAGSVLAQSDLTEPTSEDWTADEGDGLWEPPDAAA